MPWPDFVVIALLVFCIAVRSSRLLSQARLASEACRRSYASSQNVLLARAGRFIEAEPGRLGLFRLW